MCERSEAWPLSSTLSLINSPVGYWLTLLHLGGYARAFSCLVGGEQLFWFKSTLSLQLNHRVKWVYNATLADTGELRLFRKWSAVESTLVTPYWVLRDNTSWTTWDCIQIPPQATKIANALMA